ncbi:hypothetical protein ACH82I_08355 [Brevibacterium sp. GP-SGM9]|uniref:hypothetical protein n=1 Tax=Brevibacterium sp. GP-SGM9 TaxID=3376990 RepID=UPI0039A5B2A7
MLEMGTIDIEEFSIIEHTSLGTGELRDTAPHTVGDLSQRATRFEPQVAQLAGVDVFKRSCEQVADLSSDCPLQAPQEGLMQRRVTA